MGIVKQKHILERRTLNEMLSYILSSCFLFRIGMLFFLFFILQLTFPNHAWTDCWKALDNLQSPDTEDKMTHCFLLCYHILPLKVKHLTSGYTFQQINETITKAYQHVVKNCYDSFFYLYSDTDQLVSKSRFLPKCWRIGPS